jgi:hypothetical protein
MQLKLRLSQDEVIEMLEETLNAINPDPLRVKILVELGLMDDKVNPTNKVDYSISLSDRYTVKGFI